MENNKEHKLSTRNNGRGRTLTLLVVAFVVLLFSLVSLTFAYFTSISRTESGTGILNVLMWLKSTLLIMVK